MNPSSSPHFANGKICYLEIPSRDLSESASFYKNVFNWEIRTRSDGSLAFDDGVNEVSGTWRTDRAPVAALGILIHIMVDDIHKSVEAVILHGGKIVLAAGMELPEMTARFSDPTGNIFGLYQQ